MMGGKNVVDQFIASQSKSPEGMKAEVATYGLLPGAMEAMKLQLQTESIARANNTAITAAQQVQLDLLKQKTSEYAMTLAGLQTIQANLTPSESYLQEPKIQAQFNANTISAQQFLDAQQRLACALGHKACRDNRSVLYHRVPRLFEALALARGDGRYARLLKSLGRAQLLILDDWGLSVLTAAERRDLLEILEDRHGRASTIVTSQLPVDTWHGAIGDPTVADAILDRLVHNAHRLQLTGESMRKRSAKTITLDGQPEH
ncbi:ATP-binding protein [Bradyrhizobium japonicum]|uniref:ATP-binding protein n=10 Tax=Nitrobacteraceae TaxID=41294 RepID=UPI0033961CC4